MSPVAFEVIVLVVLVFIALVRFSRTRRKLHDVKAQIVTAEQQIEIDEEQESLARLDKEHNRRSATEPATAEETEK